MAASVGFLAPKGLSAPLSLSPPKLENPTATSNRLPVLKLQSAPQFRSGHCSALPPQRRTDGQTDSCSASETSDRQNAQRFVARGKCISALVVVSVNHSGNYKTENSEEERCNTGFLGQERARLSAFQCCFTAENTQLSPSLTRKPCIVWGQVHAT